jgi:hypothetical protein
VGTIESRWRQGVTRREALGNMGALGAPNLESLTRAMVRIDRR